MKILLDDIVFKKISGIIEQEGVRAYVIGGYVRDMLLKQKSKDIDIVVIGSGIAIAEKFAKETKNASGVTVFKNFGTAMLQYKDREIEFVGARKESYRANSRKPLVEDGTLEDDQNRRDFTINALAAGLNKDNYGDVLDPFNGLDDLKAGIIRTPLAPSRTFSDDPLRMIRAIRFATKIGFRIEEHTYEAIKMHKERIKIISNERIIDEVNKIMMTPKPSVGFKHFFHTGLLALFFPELNQLKGVEDIEGNRHKDNFFHTLQVLDNVCTTSDDLWLRWAALLHDVGKPKVKRFEKGTGWTFHGHDFVGSKMIPAIFRRMKLPLNDKMKYVQKLIKLHLRPIALVSEEVSDSAVRRLLFEAGDDVDDLMLLCEADITSKYEEKVNRYTKNFKTVREKLKEIEEKDAIRNFQPPVSGEEIMKVYGIPPSKQVGDIKESIKEAILEGVIRNDYHEAFAYMLKIAGEMGLMPKDKDE